MKLLPVLAATTLCSVVSLVACGGAPAAPTSDVPGADSSAAPVDASELEAPVAECPEGSPDCGK